MTMYRLGIVLLIALIFVGGELLFTYRGRYSPPPANAPALSQLGLPTYPTTPPVQVQVTKRSGVVVLDTIHFNLFFEGEMEPLLNSIAQRGYQVDFFGDRLAFAILSTRERRAALEAALRRADSYVVVLPLFSFNEEEARLVQEFAARGGKVLLVGEPSRGNEINSLGSAFGINFEKDYLYNVREHETNFRHVFFREFAQDPLTSGLDSVVLYTASSISGAGRPLIFADANTRSNMRESEEPLTPMVLHPSSPVIAISDFTFMTPPYSDADGNQRLIQNLADFLTTSTRRFSLAEFPFLFKRDVDVLMVSRQAITEATQVKQLLSTPEREARLVSLEQPQADTVVVGLYDDSEQVRPLLRAGGIDFTDSTIETPFTPAIPRRGSGVLLLDTRNGRQALVVLADTLSNLRALINQLESGEFRDGLVAPNVGLYRLP